MTFTSFLRKPPMNRLLPVLILALSACPAAPLTAPDGLPSNLVLRSYDVPGNGAGQLRNVLMNTLRLQSDGKDSAKYVGRAEVTPDGRLLVLGSAGIHDGVSALIANLKASPPRAPPTVTMDYWVVFGRPGSDAPADALKAIAPALEEIAKVDGASSFTLGEHLSVQALSGERASVDGRNAQVRQFATVIDGAVSVDVTLERRGQRVDTRLRLAPGKLVVLSSTGAVPTKDGDEPQTVYFVARAAHDGQGQ